jgi:hypothetical protein
MHPKAKLNLIFAGKNYREDQLVPGIKKTRSG